MFRKLLFTIITLFLLSSVSYAACPFTVGTAPGGGNTITCNTIAPNPDTNSIVVGNQSTNLGDELTVNANSGIDTAGVSNAVDLGLGDDIVTIDGPGSLVRGLRAITSGGALNITINGGLLEGTNNNNVVVSSGGPNNLVDIVNMFGGRVIGTSDGFATGNGNDIINILGGSVETREPIDSGAGNDQITIRNASLIGTNNAIEASVGNDIITLGTGARIEGLISCSSGFDTLIFSMDVPEETLALFSSEIAASGLPDGSITINGLFYEWRNCDLLVNQLNGVRNVRPIPTLSEWGLITMAGVLGIIGLLAIRRRKVTA